MLRRTGIAITTIIAVLALILALQLKAEDSTLMRFLKLRTSLQLQKPLQARRAFTPIAPQVSTFSTATSKMASTGKNENEEERVTDGIVGPDGLPLGLPEPPSDAGAIKFDMSSGGDTMRLDHLGPMVVNRDGTISRIGNWDKMTEMEQKNTLRIVGKRNKQRLDALKEAGDGAVDDK